MQKNTLSPVYVRPASVFAASPYMQLRTTTSNNNTCKIVGSCKAKRYESFEIQKSCKLQDGAGQRLRVLREGADVGSYKAKQYDTFEV